MTTQEILKQAIERVKNAGSYHGYIYYDDVHKSLDAALSLLAQLQVEMACPVCKGYPEPVVVYPDAKMKSMSHTELCEKQQRCPACDGEGDYKSWADGQIKDLEARIHAYLTFNVEDKQNFALLVAEKDKQIEKLEETLGAYDGVRWPMKPTVMKLIKRIADQRTLIKQSLEALRNWVEWDTATTQDGYPMPKGVPMYVKALALSQFVLADIEAQKEKK